MLPDIQETRTFPIHQNFLITAYKFHELVWKSRSLLPKIVNANYLLFLLSLTEWLCVTAGITSHVEYLWQQLKQYTPCCCSFHDLLLVIVVIVCAIMTVLCNLTARVWTSMEICVAFIHKASIKFILSHLSSIFFFASVETITTNRKWKERKKLICHEHVLAIKHRTKHTEQTHPFPEKRKRVWRLVNLPTEGEKGRHTQSGDRCRLPSLIETPGDRYTFPAAIQFTSIMPPPPPTIIRYPVSSRKDPIISRCH